MSAHRKQAYISSRFVLVVAVVIASFLAAFLGQVLITQLSLSPTLLPQQGIIVRTSNTDASVWQKRAQDIASREGSAFVRLFQTNDAFAPAIDGWVVSTDGWVVYLQQSGFTPGFVHLDSGETYAINSIIADAATDLRFAKIDADRLNPVTLAQQSSLDALDTVLTFSHDGLYTTAMVAGTRGQSTNAVISADRLSRAPRILTSTLLGSAIYNDQSDFAGLAQASFDPRLMSIVPAEYIREQLLDILRSGAIASPSIGVLYVDLSLFPTTQVAELVGAWIPPQSYATQPVLTANGSASKAGLRIGDVITAIDGVPLGARFTLADAVMQSEPGDSWELTVSRRGAPLTLNLEVQAAQ